MSNGGQVANRGFIFQAIVAEIQCLERNDWDAIKVEPETKNDKVDIMLYREGKILSAIQVKSSINPFSETKAKEWLEKLRADAEGAEEICLYLVGDKFKPMCEVFIWKNRKEVQKVPFKHIRNICTGKLVDYIRDSGIGGEVRVDDLEFIDDALFAKLFKNSIAKEPISRAAFEERFRKALPVHVIPKCLTPIPAVNYAVGLVGRDDVKKTVRGMLEKNHYTVLVNGLGGIGKTAVMQHVCNDLRNEGKYVAWIECGGSLKEDLLLLRTALGIPKSYSADDAYEKILDEIKSNVRLKENLYLFMDNLSRQLSEDEQGILTGLKVYVLATSRFEHEGFQNLPLDVLVEQSALDMFYGYYLEKQKDKTRRCEEAARDIIESVQSHTMLVELLAKAAWKKGGTLDAFRDELEKKGVFEVFERNLSTKHDKNRTIEECVMKLYEISDLSPAQQRIMRLFTIFTPEKEIYYEIGEWADLDMAAMDELVELGWLERGGLESGYQIHQIVRDSIARQMEKNGEEVRLEEYGDFLDKVIATDNYLGKEITYDKVRERIVLTEDVARFIADSGREDADTGALFNNMAGVYYAQGAYEKALEYYGKALAINERVLGTGHPDTAMTYNNMAGMYYAQGDYEKALKYFEKALAIHERVLGTGHPDTATTYNNMAGVYSHQGDYEKALEYCGKALAIRERVLGMDHPSTATTYNNMATVYYAQGDYVKALEYHEKVLTIRKRILGNNHPDTATTYSNLATVYQAQGDYKKALKYDKKALSIRECVLGTDHPDTATTYSNVASVYDDLGDYEKALEYQRKALTIREQVLGTNHPDTASSYNNMAGVYENQGDYVKSLEYHGKVLAIRERILGNNHPDTAKTYNNLASVYDNQGNYEKAIEYHRKALAINERVLGMKHPDTATSYNNIAWIYHEQGNYGKALKYYGKALAIREQVLGTNHPSTATTCNNLANVYYEQGDYSKALEYYGKALAICERVLGTNHPSTATTYNNLANVYNDLGDYKKALEYYGKALAIREQVLGTDHLSMAATYNDMAVMYNQQGDNVKALEYYRKALTIRERVLGSNHPDMATTYNNLADVYREQGDYGKALGYCGKALSIRERVLGTGHPDTATTYNTLGMVYGVQGDYEKALEYYGKALAIRARVLGSEHPLTATTYSNMAGVYKDQGDYEKALEYYGKDLAISESVLGKAHPATAVTYSNLAGVFKAQGDYEKALKYYKKAMVVFTSFFGEKHPYVKNTVLSIVIMEQCMMTGMTEDELLEMLKNASPNEE